VSTAIVSQKTADVASDFALVFRPPSGGLFLSLEQVVATDCISRGRPVIKATNHSEGKAVFFRPRCKLWSCPTCAQINANRWVAAAAHGAGILIDQGAALDFFTVTSHERLSPEATVSKLPSQWNKLRMRLRRAGNDPEWFIIPEPHQNGRLHLHGIVSASLGTRWFKDNARACGLGFMADAQTVRSVNGVVGYTAGYMVKMLQFSNFGKGFRRVRTSGGWPKLPDMPEPQGWNFSVMARDAALDEEVSRLLKANYIVSVLDHTTAWAFVNSAI